MDFAVAHAPKGATVVVFEDPPPKKQMSLLEKDKDKDQFVEGLDKDDAIYLQMGGQNDRFALSCAKQGCTVLRIPAFRLQRNGDRDEADADEKAQLAKRKRIAEALWHARSTQRAAYYLAEERDVAILDVSQTVRTWRLMQRTRISLHNQTLQLYRDLYLLRDRKEETIEEFFLRMAAEDPDLFSMIDPDVRESYIKTMAQFGVTEEGVSAREEILARSIGKKLKKLSLYGEVFEPIHGMGPLIAGRIIAGSSDIRRFTTPWKFRAIAGYHHLEDGSRARRVAKKVFPVNALLKQGVWLWTQQIMKAPLEPGSDRERLDCRKGFELVKLLREKQLLPPEFMELRFASWNDVAIANVYHLLGWIDGLRGDKRRKENPENEKEVDGVEERYAKLRMFEWGLPMYNAALRGYEAGLPLCTSETKKALKGIKGSALNKACRWLGQKLTIRIYQRWWKFVGGQ